MNIKPNIDAGLLARAYTARPFWNLMSVGYAGQASEQKTQFTKAVDFDTDILGIYTDMQNTKVRLTDVQEGFAWSADPVNIGALALRYDKARNFLSLPISYPLKMRNILKGEFLNDPVTPETGGNLVFACSRFIKCEDAGQVKPFQFNENSRMYWLQVDIPFTSSLNEIPPPPVTKPIDRELLIFGALTTSSLAKIRVFDTQDNYAWSPDYIPINAIAGLKTAINPVYMFPQLYRLKPRVQLRLECLNAGAEAAQSFTFLCLMP